VAGTNLPGNVTKVAPSLPRPNARPKDAESVRAGHVKKSQRMKSVKLRRARTAAWKGAVAGKNLPGNVIKVAPSLPRRNARLKDAEWVRAGRVRMQMPVVQQIAVIQRLTEVVYVTPWKDAGMTASLKNVQL